jgi:hypothetical protein
MTKTLQQRMEAATGGFRKMPDDFMPDALVIKAEHEGLEIGCDLRTFKRGPEAAIRGVRRSIWLALEAKRLGVGGNKAA